MIAGYLDEPLKYELVDYRQYRSGFDMRYSLDGTKMYELGWKPKVDFSSSLHRTIQWFTDNMCWLDYGFYSAMSNVR